MCEVPLYLAGAKRLVCNNVVRHILLDFTAIKLDQDCPTERLLCFYQELGYKISGVARDDVLESNSELSPQDLHDFPPKVALD